MSEMGAEGEGTIFGAGGILGVNNLQRAVDGFNRAVDSLRGIVDKLGQTANTYHAGEETLGSWNKFSNWAGNRNGGHSSTTTPPTNGAAPTTPTVGNGGWPVYTPFNPNAQAGGYTRTATGLYVPTWQGTPNGGYTNTAQPVPGQPVPGQPGQPAQTPMLSGRLGKAVFAAGMTSAAYQYFTQPWKDSKQQSIGLATVGAMASMNGTPANMRLMFGNSFGYQSTQDLAQAQLLMYQNSGNVVGSAGWNQYQQGMNQMALANPLQSGVQNQQTMGKFYTPQGWSGLNMVGINTIGKNGHRQSPLQIANQVLAQIDPNETIRDGKSAAALVNDPFSNLNITLGNWVANGIISGDQVRAIKDQVTQILKARQHNVGVKQLGTLERQASKENFHGSAADTLTSMGIGNTAAQSQKTLEAAQRQPTVDRLPEFNQALQQSTKTLVGFTNVLRDFTSNPNNPLGSVIGYLTARWQGESTFGGTFGGLLNEGWNLLKMIGGSTETRMSMPRGGAAVGASAALHNATSTGVGGPAKGTSEGGGGQSSGHSGGGSGGQQAGHRAKGSSGTGLAWPTKAHGPITATFGQAGSHWSSGHHTGIDIGVNSGTPVHAAAPGVVIYAGWNSAYGNMIKIDHGHGVVTLYGHNSRLVVHNGAGVRTGQLIAYSGATGNVTGAHLHFEVDLNGAPVDPMKYLSGGATLQMGGASSAGAGTSGSGTTTDNGAGASFGGGSLGGVGMSELDVLTAALSGGAAGGVAGASAGTSGGGGGGTAPTGGWPKVNGKGGSVSANMTLGKQLAAKYGWNSGLQWKDLVKLWNQESGWNDKAENTSSGAYGIPQALPASKIPGGYNSTPEQQIKWGLDYIAQRYGSPAKAWAHEVAMNWYDKGAWSIPEDQVAKVHKREMIIPAKEADQIREILVNGNPYGAQTKGGSGSGVNITFASGSITVTVQGTGNGESDGRAVGKAFVDTMMQDRRIRNLQRGVVR